MHACLGLSMGVSTGWLSLARAHLARNLTRACYRNVDLEGSIGLGWALHAVTDFGYVVLYVLSLHS